MGQFLQRLIARTSPAPRSPPDSPPPAAAESGPDAQGNSQQQQQPPGISSKHLIKTANTRAQLTAPLQKSVKSTGPKSPSSNNSEVASQGFEITPKQALDGAKFAIQPVDAISESKSTSSGTRRVHKVIRVAPSNFISVAKQMKSISGKPTSVKSTKSTTGRPKEQQHHHNQQPNNK